MGLSQDLCQSSAQMKQQLQQPRRFLHDLREQASVPNHVTHGLMTYACGLAHMYVAVAGLHAPLSR